MRSLILLSALGCFTSAVAAERPPMMPTEGKWAITSEMPPEQRAAMAKMDPKVQAMMKQRGMDIDIQAGTTTMTMCLNKQNMDKWHNAGEARQGKMEHQCDDPKYSVSGNTLTMDLKCSKPEPTTTHSVFQFNAAHDGYTYEHDITTPKRHLHLKGSAHRVGSC